MLRLCAVLVLLALLVPAPAALAQGANPFGPLPQAPPPPVATPEPAPQPGDGDVGRSTLFLIAVAVIGVFGGLIWLISRDARRSLPQHDRDQINRAPSEAAHKKGMDAKKRARQKTKAQRAARKRNVKKR